MIRIIVFSLLLLPVGLRAQDWKWEAPVEPAGRSGYQDIPLSPEAVCRLNPDFGNLRIIDAAGDEVPYLFYSDNPVDQEVSLSWYPRETETYSRRWYTRSVFRNPRADGIDRMVLKVRNADVRQTFWLSGSDDMDRWYIVKEDYTYDSDYDPASTYNLITIDFPPVDYKYYKVEIRHRWHEPIQIMGAGHYRISESEGNYQAVPRPEVVQQESGSRSIVDIRFDAPHYLDRLFFEVDGPEMYHREAVLKRKDSHGGYKILERFVLDSRSVHLLHFESLRAGELRLEIENRDDKPLRIAAVQALQLRKYLTANLDPQGAYTLRIGPEGLRSPVYDLSFFGKDLPANRRVAKLMALKEIAPPPISLSDTAATSPPTDTPSPALPQPVAAGSPAFPGGQALLWAGIVLIVVVLGYMAFRMLREMEK